MHIFNALISSVLKGKHPYVNAKLKKILTGAEWTKKKKQSIRAPALPVTYKMYLIYFGNKKGCIYMDTSVARMQVLQH